MSTFKWAIFLLSVGYVLMRRLMMKVLWHKYQYIGIYIYNWPVNEKHPSTMSVDAARFVHSSTTLLRTMFGTHNQLIHAVCQSVNE